MRTTIELSDAHRATLLRLAAERGDKGFSRVIAEALDHYFADHGPADDRLSARRLKGVLSEDAAAELERRVAAVRERWR